MTVEERQREKIREAFSRGEVFRVAVLCLEHLADYPDDEIVRTFAESAAAWLQP